jgi:plasmid stability protein
MPSLQIRDLPEPLHQQLLLRSREQHRSLAQQAISDLQAACGQAPRERRRSVLLSIAERLRTHGPLTCTESPEAMVRSDRDR